jgi:hypothetical protein
MVVGNLSTPHFHFFPSAAAEKGKFSNNARLVSKGALIFEFWWKKSCVLKKQQYICKEFQLKGCTSTLYLFNKSL